MSYCDVCWSPTTQEGTYAATTHCVVCGKSLGNSTADQLANVPGLSEEAITNLRKRFMDTPQVVELKAQVRVLNEEVVFLKKQHEAEIRSLRKQHEEEVQAFRKRFADGRWYACSVLFTCDTEDEARRSAQCQADKAPGQHFAIARGVATVVTTKYTKWSDNHDPA